MDFTASLPVHEYNDQKRSLVVVIFMVKDQVVA